MLRILFDKLRGKSGCGLKGNLFDGMEINILWIIPYEPLRSLMYYGNGGLRSVS